MTTSAMTTLSLDLRENGPAGASNGGFACGTLGGLVGGTARVRLAAPIPLGVRLDVEIDVDGSEARIVRAGRTLATARAIDPFVLEPPFRPTVDQAIEARRRHPFRGVRHLLSECVVCGPERVDGLRVTPGPLLEDPDVLAAPFLPTERFAVDGTVRAAAVWGALDCPSYPAAEARAGRLGLLGTLEGHLARPIRVGEELVVVGWTIDSGHRSTRTASAIVDRDGTVVASGRAVWVALPS